MSATFPEPSWGQRLLSGLQSGQMPQLPTRASIFGHGQPPSDWLANARRQLLAPRPAAPAPARMGPPMMNRAQLMAGMWQPRAGMAQAVLGALQAGQPPAGVAAQTPQSIQAAALQGLPNTPAPPPAPAAPVAQPSTQTLPVANPYDPGLGSAYPASTPLDRGGYELGALTPEQRAAIIASATQQRVMPALGQGGSYQYTAI